MREGLVYYKQQLAGYITETNDSKFLFRYEQNYLKSSAPPISVTLPKKKESFESNRLFGFFDGLIPEGWLLDLITHNYAIKAKDRMGLLLTTCSDAIGAVSVIPSAQTLQNLPKAKPKHDDDSPQTIKKKLKQSYNYQATTKCLVCSKELTDTESQYHSACLQALFAVSAEQLESEIIDMQVGNIEALAHENINRRLALTGAQQKISLSLSPVKQHMRLTVLSETGLYILKPPPEQFPDFPLVEHTTMLIAKQLGFETAAFGLIPFASGELGYITRRFDRKFNSKNPEQINKFAMEDFGQIFDRNIDADKYRGSYNQVAKWLRANAKIPGETGVNFLSQVLLAFILGNNDMHLKNIAILTEGGIRLSPIFDFVSTQLIDHEPEVELTLPVNGRDRKLRQKDWLQLTEDLGLPHSILMRIVGYFAKKQPLIESTIQHSFLSAKQKSRLIEFVSRRIIQLST